MAGVSTSVTITNQHTQSLGPWDGIIDYAGQSGIDITLASSGVGTTNSVDFAQFTGFGTLPLSVGCVANGFSRGPADASFFISTVASAIATITYEFTLPSCPQCPDHGCDEYSEDEEDDDCHTKEHKGSHRGRKKR